MQIRNVSSDKNLRPHQKNNFFYQLFYFRCVLGLNRTIQTAILRMDEHLNILIQQEIDGANTPEESAELHSILEKDEHAREVYKQFDTLSNDLSGLKFSSTVPASISENVMSEISKSKQSRKNWIGIAAAAAVLFIVALFAYNLPQPETTDVKGTIGLNNEYQNEERASEKSELSELEELQQKASFATLIDSPNFQSVSANNKLTTIIASQEFQMLSSDPQFIRFISNEANAHLITHFKSSEFPNDSEYAALFKRYAFQSLVSEYDLTTAMSYSEFRLLVQNEHFIALIQNPAFIKLLRSGKISERHNENQDL